MTHSEHYPTFIEHPRKPQLRALVKTPWEHHRQLLAWKLPGLDPVPADPRAASAEEPDPSYDPDYPKWIEHPKTGQRVLVADGEAEKAQLEAWIAKKSASTTRGTPPPPPPPPPSPAKPVTGTARAGASKAGSAAKGGPLMPPTKEELMAKNYPESIAQRMADEEVRKYNAGEAPYNKA